jgi:hypothetical protein
MTEELLEAWRTNLLTLKQSGHAVPKDVAFGIWDWDRR